MNITFNYTCHTNEPNYLFVYVEGNADDKQIENMYMDIKERAIQNQYKNILINVDQITLNYTMEKFLPLMNRLLPNLTNFNIARLCSLEDYKQDLIQNVSTNAKVNMKNFTDKSDAVSWLLEQYNSY